MPRSSLVPLRKGQTDLTDSLTGQLRERARREPGKTFVECGPATATYAEFECRTDEIAKGLADLGMRSGDSLAIISSNRMEFVETIFAAWKLGVAVVPINIYLKGTFLHFQLEDAGVDTLVLDAEGMQAVATLKERPGRIKLVIALDPVDEPLLHLPGVTPFGQLRCGEALVAEDPAPSGIASIVYTSGTTGLPKGCVLTHGYCSRVSRLMAEAYELLSNDRMITPLPLYHAGAMLAAMGAALVTGAAVVIDESFRARDALDRWIQTEATVLLGVGAMGIAMLALPPRRDDRRHSVRLASFVPFTPEQQRAFHKRFGVDVTCEVYGQTECFPISFTPIRARRRRDTVGRPARDLAVEVLDEHGQSVAVGDLGQIAVRPNAPYAMFAGYLKQGDPLSEKNGGWHLTGDLGRLDEHGFLSFADRWTHAIRRRGENVSSIAVEEALRAHPDIDDLAVHGVPSTLTEEDIKVCVVMREGVVPKPAEIFDFFACALPYFAVPRYLEVVDELPRNVLGRVMKHVLRDRGITEATWDFESLGLTVTREMRRRPTPVTDGIRE